MVKKLEVILKNNPYLKSKHCEINREIGFRLQRSGLYDGIVHNADYINHKRGYCGEFDHAANRRKKYLTFEIKGSKKSFKKAYNQLKKQELFLLDTFGRDIQVYKFFVYGTKKGYKIERVKNDY